MIDFLVNLAPNLSPKTHQKSTQEAPKTFKKGIQDMMQVGLESGTLLGRIWVDFGSKLGGNLEPSCHQNPKKKVTEKSSKNHGPGAIRVTLGREVCWPLRILQTQGPQGQEDTMKH